MITLRNRQSATILAGRTHGPVLRISRMMLRMNKERLTISLDGRAAARVRQCAAASRGGASGYLERLIREDEMREAVAAAGRWFAANAEHVEADESERVAVAEELGESA